MLVSPVAYGGFMVGMEYFWNSRAYLNAAAAAFILCCLILFAGARLFPMAEARLLPDAGVVDLKPAPGAKWGGALVVILTIGLYIVFW